MLCRSTPTASLVALTACAGGARSESAFSRRKLPGRLSASSAISAIVMRTIDRARCDVGGGTDSSDQYLLASKKLPQAWHLHCIVITWLPKSEMISVSTDRQNGHGAVGSLPRSRGLSTGRHVALFRKALQHVERRLVDGAGPGSPPNRFPAAPVDRGRRSGTVEPLREHSAQVAHTMGQLARTLQLVDISVLRADPLHRLAPGAVDRRARVHLVPPAAAMQRVIALFLEHLLEPAAQNFHIAIGQPLGHQSECAVLPCIGGAELTPLRPGSVQIGHVRVVRGIIHRTVRGSQLP